MFYQKVENGYKVRVKVVANTSKNEICNVIEDEFGIKILRVRVAAVPDDGKANKALIKFLAKEWKVRGSDIEIISGETSRKKVVFVKTDKKLPI